MHCRCGLAAVWAQRQASTVGTVSWQSRAHARHCRRSMPKPMSSVAVPAVAACRASATKAQSSVPSAVCSRIRLHTAAAGARLGTKTQRHRDAPRHVNRQTRLHAHMHRHVHPAVPAWHHRLACRVALHPSASRMAPPPCRKESLWASAPRCGVLHANVVRIDLPRRVDAGRACS